MYITPGQGQTPLWGQNFDVNRNSLSLCPFVDSLKKISLKSDFLPSVCVFSPQAGRKGGGGVQTTHWGQKFYDNRKVFSLCPYVASFKMISSKSDFIHILMLLCMYIAQGQGQKTPWGQTFDVNRKHLLLRPFVASFKHISFNSDFIHIFKCFSTCITPRGRGRQSFVDKILMSTESSCHFAHLLQV